MVDFARLIDLKGNDEVINNSRMRATLANPLGVNYIMGIGTPTSLTTAGATFTLTAAQLLTGIIVLNPTASAATATLDTAAAVVAAVNGASAGAVVGDYINVLIVNGTAGAFTVTLAAGSGGSFDTNQAAGSRVITQNASKYLFIRLTNVTPGAEAYVIYA